MKNQILIILAAGIFTLNGCQQAKKETASLPKKAHYEADFESMRDYPIPEWFLDAKFGIYTHWGAYSVPSWENEWYPRLMYMTDDKNRGSKFFDYHKKTYGPVTEFGYKDFIPMFTGEKFDANEWADLFQAAGAKFAGPVGQHHDGLAMWDSDLTEWDAKDMGPKRDIVGELAKAIRARDMKLVVSSHHAFWWKYYEPSYAIPGTDTQDPEFAGINKIYPPVHKPGDPASEAFLTNWLDRLKEVIDKYKPDYLWFDFGWKEPEFEPYKKEFLAYYYNAANDWGKDVVVTYKGTQLPYDIAVLDLERGQMDTLSARPWITDTAVGLKSWSYITEPDYKSINTLVDNLIDMVSKNGNLLLNIGPRPDGSIPQEQKDLLLGIGAWLKVNGEAIYKTRPWIMYGEGSTKMATGHMTERENKGRTFNSGDIRFTTRENYLYALALDWPSDGKILVKSLNDSQKISTRGIKSVSLVGVEGDLQWSQDAEGLHVSMPDTRPCENAYSLKIALKGDWVR